MLKFLKNLLASPFAGIYAFLLLFVLATITGELDPLQFVYSRVFPDNDSFGATVLSLEPVKDSQNPEQLNEGMGLLLLRHNKRVAERLTLLRKNGGKEVPALLLGSASGTVLPRSQPRAILEPLVLIDAEVPPGALLAMMMSNPRIGQSTAKYVLSNGTIEKGFDQDDLLFSTRNELRGFRIFYGLCVLVAGMLGFSLPKFSRLTYPGEVHESGGAKHQPVEVKPSL